MRITNKTKKAIVTSNARCCHSFFSKARGLMFSKQKNLIFIFGKERKAVLHMWFVFYPIDVLFVNKQQRVVEIKENFKPFSIYWPKEKAQYVIELSRGTVKKSKTAIADVLVFGL